MQASVTRTEDGVDSFIVYGDRTKWFWRFQDGKATFTRVEVDKDEHSTDEAIVLFSGEWVECMYFVEEQLPFVEDIHVDEPLDYE